MPRITRRDFNKAATAIGVGAAAPAWVAARVPGANERIRLGFIGLGNRGDQVLDAFLVHKDAEVAAICDIHKPYLDFAAQKIGGRPQQFHDYRKMLDVKELDAVVIATPDHWHALQMIHACMAGKDVYVEKPLSLAVTEGRAMVKAALDAKRVVQVGIQRRSSPFCKEVADLIQGGGIGKITAVRCFHIQNEWPKGITRTPDEDPPKDFDWEAWLGPAPKRRYNKNRTFYRFRWFYDYSGGQVTNFGVHYLAQIHWALGVSAPRSVMAMGGKFADYDNREVPDTMEVVWHYPPASPNGEGRENTVRGDVLVTFSQYNATAAGGAARPCEIEFRGTKGTLYFYQNGYEVVPDLILPNEFAARTPQDRSIERSWRAGGKAQIEAKKVSGRISDADHARNFLECVKSRQMPSCDIEFGHRCTSAALIANIAHKTRSFLEWDAKAEHFTNNNKANDLLSVRYRSPYQLPV
jgi:predicted dehydrogenase